MSLIYSIRVDTAPVAKARPRVTMRGGKARAYTPKKSADYERLIASHWKHAPTDKPVALRMEFGMPIPASWPKYRRAEALQGSLLPAKKPDIDNLVKAVLDALNGIAYDDDGQVVEVSARKVYTESPAVKVELHDLGGNMYSAP